MTPLQYAVFHYTPADGSPEKEVVIRCPDFGNKDTSDPGQRITRTPGRTTYVFQFGSGELRELNLKWTSLTDEERGDLEEFFSSDFVDRARHWFFLTLVPHQREVICVEGTVAGETVACDSGYAVGDKILMDQWTFPARLVSPSFDWDEPGDDDGLFFINLTIEVMSGFLPDNN